MTHRKAAGLQQIGSLLREVHPELIISKRRFRKVESIERAAQTGERPSESGVLIQTSCPLRPAGPAPAGRSLLHERRNGQFILQVIGHPGYGLPWRQDR